MHVYVYFSFHTPQVAAATCAPCLHHMVLLSLMKSAAIEAPMNLQAHALSATSIEITWNHSGNKTISNATSYEIMFAATEASEHYPSEGVLLTSKQHFIVQNLHPFSEYLLSVTSIDLTGARSETVSMKAMTFSAGGSSCMHFMCNTVKMNPLKIVLFACTSWTYTNTNLTDSTSSFFSLCSPNWPSSAHHC